MLLPCTCQKLVCSSTVTCRLHMPISSCGWKTAKSVYMHHMNTLQSAMWPGLLAYIHFTLLAYGPEQICLPNNTCMSHCTATVVHIWTLHYCTHPSKANKLKYVFTTLLQTMCQQQICPSNATCSHSLYITGRSMPIYMLPINLLA